MPSRNERHHKASAVHDDAEPYYDDRFYDRPRGSRRISRSVNDAGGAGHHRSRRHTPSPVRPSRGRSEDHRHNRPPARRYDDYSDYSASEDDRHRRRGHGKSSRRKEDKTSGSSKSVQNREADKAAILQAAASAAVVAGAAEAWRMRKEKTSWSKKGTRMATAAAGAAAIAAFNNSANGSHGGKGSSGSKKDALQATIGGLLVNRLTNSRRK
ncbi:uncharacterized protein LY79DRAFT_572321 [Colletotrichum navitas]|uniref:DUF3824 domain-containing protein n=1 Tax=Colletotrichum navitas TaxID=681940 RepID=A0AAD8PK47_9PEZI|nr:uncharacterized protein LY79DRAFT_572321 [Colletotrichum navitas]KAK1566296.1 hypothetical protein LY79DRAFT_572321 [Colletotrichum navitas]